jgi:uncharacterized protein with von Willebrand factor type A (vWA) domain
MGDIKISRDEEIIKNINTFDKLSPSEKIRYVERARKRLQYWRTLVEKKGASYAATGNRKRL